MAALDSARVAVDVMSGDGGVDVALSAVRLALAADPQLYVDLVGDPELLPDRLAAAGLAQGGRIELVAAGQVLSMDAGPARALRQGRGSSMQVALERVAEQASGAVVSAGNTGALMALSRQVLGMLPGIERPALMAALPTVDRAVWALDLGANVSVDAQRLCEFARMGSTAVGVLENRQPRVGLLNIGHEPSKGPDVVREAARLIEAESGLDFRGFVEADRVFAGDVDLVVCDGFAGNVLLKSAEGMARLLFTQLRGEVTGWRGAVLRRPLARVYDKLDPARHNGAPLLGVRGNVIKSHGSACERGFATAIGLAALEARRNLIPELEQALWASY
ncbi:MAG: phosphate acyltransferase PlsX [Xanthomonadales bacterium]|nr:phosphate acyltransferase PlsX [Xanthomonadales bacterium]